MITETPSELPKSSCPIPAKVENRSLGSILAITVLFFMGLASQYKVQKFSTLAEKSLIVASCAAFYLFFCGKEQKTKILRLQDSTNDSSPPEKLINETIQTEETVELSPQEKKPIELSPAPLQAPPKNTKLLQEIPSKDSYFYSSEAPLTQEELGVRLFLNMEKSDFQKLAVGLRTFLCQNRSVLRKKLERDNLTLKDFLKMSHKERYEFLIEEKIPHREISRENVSQVIRRFESRKIT